MYVQLEPRWINTRRLQSFWCTSFFPNNCVCECCKKGNLAAVKHNDLPHLQKYAAHQTILPILSKFQCKCSVATLSASVENLSCISYQLTTPAKWFARWDDRPPARPRASFLRLPPPSATEID